MKRGSAARPENPVLSEAAPIHKPGSLPIRNSLYIMICVEELPSAVIGDRELGSTKKRGAANFTIQKLQHATSFSFAVSVKDSARTEETACGPAISTFQSNSMVWGYAGPKPLDISKEPMESERRQIRAGRRHAAQDKESPQRIPFHCFVADTCKQPAGHFSEGNSTSPGGGSRSRTGQNRICSDSAAGVPSVCC